MGRELRCHNVEEISACVNISTSYGVQAPVAVHVAGLEPRVGLDWPMESCFAVTHTEVTW